MGNDDILKEMIIRHPELSQIGDRVENAADCIINSYLQGHKVLVCGSGGSSADSDHIVGELMKGFEHSRPVKEPFKKQLSDVGGERGLYLAEKLQKGFPAISLTAHNALITAVANDMDADLVFAQQVLGYGKAGDILIGISTSGNSQKVIDAIITARAMEMSVIGLTGESGGKMKNLCDILLNVPEKRTSYVQELHLPVYHTLCLMVENHFFGNHHLL